jgi:serine/threonine protein kinase
MEFTVENICGFLIRSKLLTADQVKSVYQGWVVDAKDASGNVQQFTRWLSAKQFVTEYQAKLLSRGQADDFFLCEYKILDRLGQGRMAGVYKAVHSSGQVVAIKVLPPSRAANPQMVARFQREARLAMRMKHPHIVRAFQLAETKGLHYLVMEYLEGETLEEVLYRRKRLPVNEAVRVVHQALLGLQHIHEQKLVHRDLKPANLMLVPAAPPGGPDTTLAATVKILDFGLGRPLLDEAEGENSADMRLTGEGVLLGTPDYLAPEQARDPRAIDVRADIYSLGGVLYHCLAGQPPFPDSNILGQMVRHATEKPRPVRELNPAVPDGLQRVLDWMLAKDPDERYPTPGRAAQALQVFLVAGSAPKQTAEEEAKMRSFLTWLEKTEAGTSLDGAPLPASPSPPPVPAQRRGKPGTGKFKPVKGPKVPAPAAAPPADPSEFDVALVAAEPSRGLALGARDWLMMGIGAGAVIAAGMLGWVVSLLARG